MPSISQRMAQSEGRPTSTRRPAAAAAPDAPPKSRQPFVPTTQGDWGGFLDAQAHKPGGTARRQKCAPPPPPPPPPPPSNWSRYVDATSGKPYWHDAHSGETTWDEPVATQPPPPPPRERWVELYDDASERPYYHDPASGSVRWDEPDSIDEHGSALFALSGKAVPPPPSEGEEEAAPPARTLRRPSNPFIKPRAAAPPVVDSSSESEAEKSDLAARVAALEKTVAALVRRLARS